MVSFVVSIFIAFFIAPHIDQETYPRIVTFILSFLVLNLISINISNFARSGEIEKNFESVRELVAEARGSYLVGDIDAVMKYLAQKLPLAKAGFNTRVSVVTDRNPSTDYEIIYGEKIVSEIVSFVRANKTWCEVISSDGERRAKSVLSKIRAKDRFYAYRLHSDFPIMNFVILEYENEKREVLFGFGLHPYQENDHIYGSTDPKIVENFFNFFRILRDKYSIRITLDNRVSL